MRNIALICALSATCLFCSCNPKVTTLLLKKATPLTVQQEIKVIELDDSVPSTSVVIGDVKIDDAGLTTNCSYEYVLELAKMEARKAGGNALKITKHAKPDFVSSCHRLSAYILLLDGTVSETVAQDSTHSLNEQVSGVGEKAASIVLPRYRFNIHGGLSEVLGKTPDNIDAILLQYNKNLNSGYSFGTDCSYFFSESTGFGVKCDIVRTSNSLNGVQINDGEGHQYFGNISDDITVFYVGPTLNYRKIGTQNRNTFYLSASAGFNSYYNQACVINRLIANGSTFGSSVDMGYDINLSKRFAVGVKLSLTSGLLKKLTIDDGSRKEQYTLEEDSYVSLSHIDFSVGLSFIR